MYSAIALKAWVCGLSASGTVVPTRILISAKAGVATPMLIAAAAKKLDE